MPDEGKNKYVKIAKDIGYNTSDLVWIKQDKKK